MRTVYRRRLANVGMAVLVVGIWIGLAFAQVVFDFDFWRWLDVSVFFMMLGGMLIIGILWLASRSRRATLRRSESSRRRRSRHGVPPL